MRKNILILMNGMLLLLLFTSSCKHKGCMDPNALNYDPNAEVDNGKCKYPVCGDFTDARDGQTYKVVTIGKQCWMAEDLNFYTDTGSACYNNDPANCDTLGRLYNWWTAKTVIPDGWHLPSDAELDTLFTFLGGKWAGGKLKVGGSSGFNAQFGGWGGKNNFLHLGLAASFWGSSEIIGGGRTMWGVSDFDNRILWGGAQSYWRFYIRCIKD